MGVLPTGLGGTLVLKLMLNIINVSDNSLQVLTQSLLQTLQLKNVAGDNVSTIVIYLKGVLMLLQNFSGLLISTFGLCNKSVVSADCKEYISFINWVYLNHKRRTCVIEHLEYLKLIIELCIRNKSGPHWLTTLEHGSL